MRSYVILNPRAGSAEQATALHDLLLGRDGVVLRVTSRPGQATEFAAEAIQAGYDLIVAAGGDGTIHEVVTGLAANFGQATLGLIPLGTGNDLARLLAIPADPLAAFDILLSGTVHHLDLIRAETVGKAGYAINVCAGGFSGQVDEVLTEELKLTWGPLAFLIGAASVLPELTAYQTTIAWEDGPMERIEALNIIVANGRTVAGGIAVAPQANPEDGLLDVIVVRFGSAIDLAGVAARLLAGNYLNSELVTQRRAQRVRIAASPGMWFNLDGELWTNEMVTFTALPQMLRVIVGPDYRAQAMAT
jgi:diacylglycerol kinase (ATP)